MFWLSEYCGGWRWPWSTYLRPDAGLVYRPQLIHGRHLSFLGNDKLRRSFYDGGCGYYEMDRPLLASLRRTPIKDVLRIAALGLPLVIGTIALGFAGGFYGRAVLESFTQVPGATQVQDVTPSFVKPEPRSSAPDGLAEYQRPRPKDVDERVPERPLLRESVSEAPSRSSLPAPTRKPARPSIPPGAPFTPDHYWDAPGYRAR